MSSWDDLRFVRDSGNKRKKKDDRPRCSYCSGYGKKRDGLMGIRVKSDGDYDRDALISVTADDLRAVCVTLTRWLKVRNEPGRWTPEFASRTEKLRSRLEGLLAVRAELGTVGDAPTMTKAEKRAFREQRRKWLAASRP